MNEYSLTQQLISLIRLENITQPDLDTAALFVLDAIANMVAGRNSEAGRIILDWVKDRQSDDGRCAFAFGALTHMVEMDDLHRKSVTHPGCVVVPAVLAKGLRLNSDGHEILTAVLHGFEACARMGMAVGTEHYKIWHNTATCGPFGSAMAISSLLKLDQNRTVDALGNAGTQSSGFWQFLETGAMSKHLHAGRAAESGVLAAELAGQGFTGPLRIIEGEKGMFAGMCLNPSPAELTADIAGLWQLHQTSIKPWPSCRHTHPVVDAALEIADDVDMDLVKSVSIETYQAAVNVCNRPQPASLYEAKFSLQYCVVAALSDGKVDFGSFNEYSRKRLGQWTHQVDVLVDRDYEAAYPDAWGASVCVKFIDDRQIKVRRSKCKGDPDMPVTRAELIDKSKMLMEYGGMTSDQAEDVISDVLSLAENKHLSVQQIYSLLN